MKHRYVWFLFGLIFVAILLGSCDRDLEKFLVSGVVTQDDVGLMGVSIHYEGRVSGTVETDAQGEWEALMGGAVTVTPVKDGYSFTPPSVDLIVEEEKTGVDFTASYEGEYYSLRITLWGSGTVYPQSGETYPENAIVTLTVEPHDGWFFWQWSGPQADYIEAAGENTYEIQMVRDMDIEAQFGLSGSTIGVGIPVSWDRKAKGQLQTCGECTWYWPINYDWSQSKVVGPCPCGNEEQAVLEPSNWTIDDFPDSGSHRVTIGGGNTVLLDRSAVLHSLDNRGFLETFSGRGLEMTGGGLENSGTVELAIDSHFDLYIGMVNSGLIDMACGAGISLSGPLNNSGTIVMEGPQARGTDLELKGDVHLIGQGTINLLRERFVRIYGLDGERLVNEDNTIHGSGEIGYSTGGDNAPMEITNRGEILADMVDEMLTVRPGTSSYNDGLMIATEGGILRLSGEYGGNLDNTFGIIRAEGDSSVKLANGVMIKGGVLESISTGQFYTHLNPQASLEDLTFKGHFNMGRGAVIELRGSIDNQGLIDMPALGGMPSVLEIMNQTTLTGGGVIQLGTEFFGRIDGQSGILYNEDNTIRGCGEIGWTDLTVINEGQIVANVEDKVLTLRPGEYSPSLNNNLMVAQDGGILGLSGSQGGELDNTQGIIRAEEDSHVLLKEGIILTGGILETLGTGRVYTHLNPQATLKDITLKGLFDMGNGATISIIGTIDNQGVIDVPALGGQSAVLELLEDTTLTGDGIIQLGQQFFARITGAEEGLTLHIAQQTISGEGRLGYGTLRIINEGVIEASHAHRILDITTFEGEALVNQGVVRSRAGAIVSVAGEYSQGSEGELQIHIGLVDEDLVSGQFRVGEESVLDGIFSVTLVHDCMPPIGSEFKVLDLDFTQVSGAFADVVLPALSEGTWDKTQLLTAGLLRVVD